MWLELCINLSSVLSLKKHLINCNKWEGSNAGIQTCVFDINSIFYPTVAASVAGLHLRCAGQVHSLE